MRKIFEKAPYPPAELKRRAPNNPGVLSDANEAVCRAEDVLDAARHAARWTADVARRSAQEECLDAVPEDLRPLAREKVIFMTV